MAWLANMPRSPAQYLVEVSVGLFITISSVAMSNVAVVSNPLTFDPWPISVITYAPIISKLLILGSQYFFCSTLAKFSKLILNMHMWIETGSGP